MIGKRAKILIQAHVEHLLFFAGNSREPIRNRVTVLLPVKAWLRAAEIANLTWKMTMAATGEVATVLELHDRIAKKPSGQVIPIHPDLRAALGRLHEQPGIVRGPVIRSERGTLCDRLPS